MSFAVRNIKTSFALNIRELAGTLNYVTGLYPNILAWKKTHKNPNQDNVVGFHPNTLLRVNARLGLGSQLPKYRELIIQPTVSGSTPQPEDPIPKEEACIRKRV